MASMASVLNLPQEHRVVQINHLEGPAPLRALKGCMIDNTVENPQLSDHVGRYQKVLK